MSFVAGVILGAATVLSWIIGEIFYNAQMAKKRKQEPETEETL